MQLHKTPPPQLTPKQEGQQNTLIGLSVVVGCTLALPFVLAFVFWSWGVVGRAFQFMAAGY